MRFIIGTVLSLLIPGTSVNAQALSGDGTQTPCDVTTPNLTTAVEQTPGFYGHRELSVALAWAAGTVVFKPGGPGHVLPDGSLSMIRMEPRCSRSSHDHWPPARRRCCSIASAYPHRLRRGGLSVDRAHFRHARMLGSDRARWQREPDVRDEGSQDWEWPRQSGASLSEGGSVSRGLSMNPPRKLGIGQLRRPT
jgi:hypothetical protein